MEGKKSPVLSVILIIVALIVGIVIGKFVMTSNNNSNDNDNVETGDDGVLASVTENVNTLSVYEEFSVEGTIENVENASWTNAIVNQYNNKVSLELMVENTSSTEKIEATTVTIDLVDKRGNVIITSDVEMEEIEPNGTTTLKFKANNADELQIYYNIIVRAK